MKVTREEGFKPITIVLETKEEAQAIYNVIRFGKISAGMCPWGNSDENIADALATKIMAVYKI